MFGADDAAIAVVEEAVVPKAKAKRSWESLSGRLIRVGWAVALVVMLLSAYGGYTMIENAESAPQQAAGAAMACFYMIVPYVLARATQAILR
jgi:hypothetical protein